jgi:hypothetical protein
LFVPQVCNDFIEVQSWSPIGLSLSMGI